VHLRVSHCPVLHTNHLARTQAHMRHCVQSSDTPHYCPFTHLEYEDGENQMEQGTDLPCGLYLIPLIGHKVCPPHADRLWYCASSQLTVGLYRGAVSPWSLPVNEKNVNRNLPPEQMNYLYNLKHIQIHFVGTIGSLSSQCNAFVSDLTWH
jgi:hypothetical protein